MKILLVDNHTRHLKKVQQALVGHQVEVLSYQPGVEFNTQGKDLVILSGGGGEGYEIQDPGHKAGSKWYDDEAEFVLRCDKPIIGICMGFEVICHAYGSKVESLGWLVQGYNKFGTTRQGRDLVSRNQLKQFESHEWCIKDVSAKHFEVLADSDTGIEFVKHKTRPILASQFHPEFRQGSIYLPSLVSQFGTA